MDTDPDDEPTIGENDNECLKLSYKTEQEKAMRISKVPIQQDNTRPPAINNEATPSHITHEDEVINI